MPREIDEGRITSGEAGRRLAEPCVCGIFNPARAEELLENMAGGEKP